MILFLTAFDAEARPLIDRFRLKRQPDQGFHVYAGDDAWLVVSGPGKASAAAATAHLHGRAGFPENAAWINIGIAGHRDLAQGEARLVHKLTDGATGRNWYPAITVHAPWDSLALVTLDRPDTEYAHDALVDMEASGFMETALRFSTGELVHCVKVVSDNCDNPAAIPKAPQVHAWIGPQMDAVERFAGMLLELAGILAPPAALLENIERLTAAMHVTTSQRNRLRHQLQQWHALHGDAPLPDEVGAAQNARTLLESLQAALDAAQLELA
ncbi:MAG: hypothetical protein P8Z78_10230 [Gammaproteobacteria bacterium]